MAQFWFESAVEAQNFPAWELYVFFTLCLLISIIVRLARIEKKLEETKQGFFEFYDSWYGENK
tara:strand:- start:285 stop:473 length:189 start_codon:yes stop_codon:yes gene_type:complete